MQSFAGAGGVPERGAQCRQLRLQAGLSIQAFAERVGRSPSVLSRFERGKTSPRQVETLIAAYRQLRPPEPPRRSPMLLLAFGHPSVGYMLIGMIEH